MRYICLETMKESVVWEKDGTCERGRVCIGEDKGWE